MQLSSSLRALCASVVEFLGCPLSRGHDDLVDRRQQMSPDPFSLVTPDERSEIRGPSRPWQHGPRLARLRRFAGVTTEDVLHWVSSVRVAPLERVPDGALESAFLGSVTQLS